jgi:cytochrome c553
MRTLRICGLLLACVAAACSAPVESIEPVDTTPATENQDGVSLEYARWETNEPGDYLNYNRRTNLLQRGREVYMKHCVGCHGETGAGDGPAVARLLTRPRDFTSGIYKFRSTDSGSLPLESDLYRTITRGLSGVSMPSFPLRAHRDKVAVI